MQKTQKTDSQKRLHHAKKKKLSKKAIVAIVIVCTLGAALIGGAIAGGIWLYNSFSYEPDPEIKDLPPEELDVPVDVVFPKGIKNIALFGLDSRNTNFQGRSDSIMILSVNCDTGKIKLVSVVRDSLVEVEGHGYQKINAAYAFGGPKLAIKTLNKTFKLNITDYATVDFVGMAEIIDVVGGIEVELTKAEVYQVNAGVDEVASVFGSEAIHVTSPGVQTLNGTQAVSFARIRKVPTVNGTHDDYGRTERQRLVMNKLMEKAMNLPLLKYPELIKTMLPYIRTSMTYDDIFELSKILKADNITMEQGRIPVDKAIISSGFSVPYLGSCVYYDLDYAAKLLSAFFFEETTFEKYMELNGVEKTDWYDGPRYQPSTDKDTDTSSDTDISTDTSGGGSDGPSGSVGTSGGGTTDTGTVTDTGNTTDKTDSGGSSDTGTTTDKSDKTDNTDTSDKGPSTDTGNASDTSDKNE